MATIYRNGQKFAGTGSSTASQVILSSALHIGGETQTNAEDAVHALSESGGGGSSLADLDNVEISNPQDGDMLYYDSINFVWTNHPLICSWSDGTDEQIINLLTLHYNGDIDLHDFWEVGDERVVHFDAMEAIGVGESHRSQDIIMVLMNKGGKTLTTPINGHTECAFIVGQKNGFCTATAMNYIEGGYMNSTDTNSGGWDSCARRTWCNSIYKNALSNNLIGIFKQHQNITANGTGSTTITSNDYFALASEKEVFGNVTYANATAEANNNQFKYYETSSNRRKSGGNTWWLRSPCDSDSARFCNCSGYNNSNNYNATYAYAIAPFGVI